MRLSTSLSALAGLGTAVSTPVDDPASPASLPPNPAHLFQNPDPLSPSSSSSSAAAAQRIPTSYESAVLGRRILALSPLATLSTVFPASYAAANEDADGLPHSILLEHRPLGLGGMPIGLMDYIADCDSSLSGHEGGPSGDVGNPTILAIRIATSFKNVDAGSNMSVSVSWVPPHPPAKRIESTAGEGGMFSWLTTTTTSRRRRRRRMSSGSWWPRRWWWWRGAEDDTKGEDNTDTDTDTDMNVPYDPVPYSAANLPRFSLLGYLEPIRTSSEAEAGALQSCFLAYHPDARYWLPGNRIHQSEWVRLVVTQVYWIGGFGDRAYIGWIPIEEWRNVTRKEWEGVRLPGEKKGWKEWSVGSEEWEL